MLVLSTILLTATAILAAPLLDSNGGHSHTPQCTCHTDHTLSGTHPPGDSAGLSWHRTGSSWRGGEVALPSGTNGSGSTGSSWHSTGSSWHSTGSSWRDGEEARPSGTIGSGSTPLIVQSTPTATLLPTVHWDHDTSSLSNLIPSDGNAVYYAQDGTSRSNKPHQMAWLTTYFSAPSIVLDHCSLVQTVRYSYASKSLTVSFTSRSAFDQVAKTWQTDAGLVLIANPPEWEGYANGESCYFTADTFEFQSDSLTVTIVGKASNLEGAMTRAEVEWGTYTPPSSSNGPRVLTNPSDAANTNATSGRPFSPASPPTFGNASQPSSFSANNSTSVNGFNSTSLNATNSSSLKATNSSSLNATISSSLNATHSSCAPPDTKYNLPVACLGKTFDTILDDNLGYENVAQTGFASFAASFTPNLEYPDATPDDAADDAQQSADQSLLTVNTTAWSRRSASPYHRLAKRRCWYPSCLVKAVVKAAVDAVVPGGIPGITKPIPVDLFNKQLGLEIPKQRNLVQSPWGQQVLIKSFSKIDSKNSENNAKLDIYCVDCGAKGSATISGKAAFTALDGITSGQVSFVGDVSVILKVGVDAQATYTEHVEQKLFEVPLSPFTIPGGINVGPYMRMGADVNFNAAATGQLLAGAEFSLQNARATVDFFDTKQSSASGWQVEFKPTLEAKGELQVSVDVGIPIATAIGVSVLGGKFKKEVAVYERPAIAAQAQVAASIGLTSSNTFAGGFSSANGCTGISTQIGFQNKMWVDVLGLTSYTLSDPPVKTLSQGCIKLPSTGGSPPSKPSDTATPAPATDSAVTPAGDGTSTLAAVEGLKDSKPTAANRPAADPTGQSSSPTNVGSEPAAAAPQDSSINPAAAASGSAPVDQPNTDSAGERRSLSLRNSTTGSGTTSNSTIATDSTPSRNFRTAVASTAASSTNSTNLSVTDASDDSDFSLKDIPDTGYNTTDGYEVTSLVDSTSAYQVLPCADGNLYLFGANDSIPNYECAEMWLARDDVIVADGMARIAHYYPNTMALLNVSRVRVSDVENVPVGSEYINFTPYDLGSDDNLPPTYFGVDQYGQYFFTAVCLFADQPSKVFLVADVEYGLQNLMSPDLEYTVTGGVPTSCYYLPLIQGS